MKAGVAIAAVAVAFLYAAVRTGERISLARDRSTLRQAARADSVPEGRRSARSPAERDLSAAARDSGLRRLTSITTTPDGDISLEFEAEPDAAFRFLALVQNRGWTGDLRRLRLTAGMDGGVKGQAGFAAAAGPPPTRPLPAMIRNPFLILAPAPAAPTARASAREEAARRRQAAREDEERRHAETARRLEERKSYFQNGFILSGIAGAGPSAVAFLMSGADHRSLMVKVGDAVDEARVSGIDPERGEVRLDGNGLFTVVLRLSGNRP